MVRGTTAPAVLLTTVAVTAAALTGGVPGGATGSPSGGTGTRVGGWGPALTTLEVGSQFTDVVRVRPRGEGRRFQVTWRRGAGRWEVAQKGRVQKQGRVRIRLTPPVPGRYSVRLRVARSGTFRAVRTVPRTLLVTARRPAPPPVVRPTPTPTPEPTPSATPSPSSSATPPRQLLPAVARGTGFTAYAVGDIGMCGGAPEQTAALIPAGGLVFAAGDLAYPDGTMANFIDCYLPYYGRLLDTTEPVPGNHEYRDPELAYFDVFGAKVGTRADPWYHVQQGDWSFYHLNSNCDESGGGCDATGRQYQWLKAQLEADPRTCKAVMWHHPRWAATVRGNYPRTSDMYQLLIDHGADLLLTGHEHNYMRYPRLDSSGAASATGLRQFVVGTGGVSPGNLRLEKTPSPEVAKLGTYGVLKLDFRPDGYSWNFVATDSSQVDSGSDTC